MENNQSALTPTILRLEGMTCSACVTSIERSLNAIPGVNASVNFATETAHVLAPTAISIKELIDAVTSAGYSAQLVTGTHQVALESKKSGAFLLFALIFTLPVLVISMNMNWHHAIDRWILGQLDNFNILHPLYSATSWLAIALSAPVILIIALPIHRAAIKNIMHPTMDTLISLGSFSAFFWSIYANTTGVGDVYTEVAATVITLVIAGRFLESRAKVRASSALSTLLSLGSKEVCVLRNGELVSISINELKVGDEFHTKPGQVIATDGVVISGSSAVDNALLTGESIPIDVSPGSGVIGSSLNRNGYLIIRATRIGADTELARITAMVVNAQSGKAPIQRLADRIAAIFVPVVTVISVATFFGWRLTDHSLTQSITSAIAVLVIACPCALGLATPVALLVVSGRGARRGIVIRQPRVLEVAPTIDSVLLDKTGTLTTGVMSVQSAVVVPAAGEILGPRYKELLREEIIFSSALSIESQSEHPVAGAIAQYLSAQGLKTTTVSEFSTAPGFGAAGRVNLGFASPVVLIGSPLAVAHSTTPFHPDISHAIGEAENLGLTVSLLAWDGIALGVFCIEDRLKKDAPETIAAFKKRGIETWLVTGDSPEVALSTADLVGISPDRVLAGALPHDKVAHILVLQAEGKRVLMVGDGINDAPALATADLSIAMGTGSDSAIAVADITLMRNDLGGVLDALDLSKRTLKIIRGNLAWAFLYNAIGIPIAALGGLNPMVATGAMALSSLFVVTNSLRIK